MTQPPNVPPPPPSYAPPPLPPPGAYMPPGYQPPMPVGQPGGGRVQPTRLIVVFVVVLAIGLALGAAVVLALQPGAKKPDCPDPSVPCGQPPVQPTLPPIARTSPTPAPTVAPTIVKPSGSLVVSSAEPSIATTPAPTTSTAPSGNPSAPPSAPPSVAPSSAPPIANLPQPQPASNADPMHTGTVWSSKTFGFGFEYDDSLWTVEQQNDGAIELSAGRGAVLVLVEGFKASESPKSLVQSKINSLSNQILGLQEESDPARQLPGQPVVGHRQGVGVLLNGTIDQPQGPQANVDVVVLAASDSQISIRITVLTDDDLRDAAFAVVDSINNSIEWPSEQ